MNRILSGSIIKSRFGMWAIFVAAFFLFQSFAPVSLNNLLVLPLTVNQPRPCEAAVVHGSGLGDQGEIRIYAQERLDCAVDAYRRGLVRHIISSGGTYRAGAIEALAMRDYLISCGIDSAALVVEAESKNTWENVRNSERILQANHWGTPLVVTSPFHSMRCRKIWQRVLNTSDVPTLVPAHSFITNRNFMDRWGGLYTLGREYAALAKYWLQGRLS